GVHREEVAPQLERAPGLDVLHDAVAERAGEVDAADLEMREEDVLDLAAAVEDPAVPTADVQREVGGELEANADPRPHVVVDDVEDVEVLSRRRLVGGLEHEGVLATVNREVKLALGERHPVARAAGVVVNDGVELGARN